MRSGQPVRRRRTLAIVGVGLAAALAVSGGIALAVVLTPEGPTAQPATQPTDGSSAPTVPASNTPAVPGDSGAPTAPPGTRLVGFDGIGIAVPAAWSTNGGGCQNAAEDTVFVGENLGEDCGFMVETGEISSAHLLPDTSGFSRAFVNHSVPDGAVHGIRVSRFSTRAAFCNPEPTGGPEAPCHMYEGALVLPSRHVTIWVRSPKREVIDAVLDSTFVLPAGYGAVPDRPTQQSLARLGYAVHERLHYRPRLIAGWLLGVSPEVGSIIPLGSPVTLTLSSRVRGNPCAGLVVELVTPAGGRALSTLEWQQYTVRLHVGDVVRIDSAGACAGTVRESAQNTAMLRETGADVFTAARAGTTRLLIDKPMCAGAPPSAHCVPGSIDFAEVTVLVQP